METELNEIMNAATLNHDNAPMRKLLPAVEPNGHRLIEPEELLDKPIGKPAAESKTTTPKKNNRRMQLFVGIAAVGLLAATAFYYDKFIAPYESTDDAFIEADATPIAPQVAGQVVRLLVNDNQEVKANDLLLEIDPREFQAKVDQTRANLAAAQSRLEQANAQYAVDLAKVDQEKANVVAAEAQAAYAAADLKRYQSVGSRAVSESQLDLAGTQARSTAAQVDAARDKEFSAEAQAKLDKANIQSASAEVALNEANVRQAELDLSYTKVTAPVSGFVTHRGVDNGAYVQPGQNLLAVMPHKVWVIANFKETQLAHMRVGQPVRVKVDAYPQARFTGHVDSIQAGTGARFSLLPPENATGNYVKVVQRVPVKIVLDDVANPYFVLGAGMSVVPEVRVK